MKAVKAEGGEDSVRLHLCLASPLMAASSLPRQLPGQCPHSRARGRGQRVAEKAGCTEGGAAPSCSLIPGGMHVCTWQMDTCSLGLICPLTMSVLSFIYATSADQCLQHARSWGSCCGFCRD